MMNTSSAFPLNADGRHILPLPSRIVVPELLPAFPGVQPTTFEPLAAYPLTSQHRTIPTSGHKRNTSASTGISSLSATLADDLFSSSSDSEGASSVTTPSPSSSRCSSPSAPTCRYSLVPRGAPFPENVSLNDIDPTDALLFFPDANAEPSRAILLVGPAIARHMHNQRTGKAPLNSTRSRARMHPYRIIVRPSRGESDESCSISRVLLGSRSRRGSCDDAAEEQEMWREWSRGRYMDREVSRAWRNLIRPRNGSASSAASSSCSLSD